MPLGGNELKSSSRRRVVGPLAILAIFGLGITGCSSTAAAAGGAVGKADGVVTITGPITDNDAKLLEQSWSAWAAKNHITINYSGSKDFEEQIGGAAQQGNAPDLAIFEQPGLIGDLASRGYLKAEPAAVNANIKANYTKDWGSYTTFKGVQYASPLLASLNGWVWYSPKQLAGWGVDVPSNWSDLYRLSQTLQSKMGGAPWCEGFSSDAASGAAGTDWIEDLVLRQDGAAVYDQWVKHEIPFSDPRIKRAFDDAAEILLDKNYVNAGMGDVNSIDTTSTLDVARALVSGKCALTHQGTSFLGELQDPSVGAPTVGPHGDLWAFMLPPLQTNDIPVTGGGDFVAAFSNDADTVKVQKYLSSTSWAKSRVALGGAISPDRSLLPGSASSPLLQYSIELLQSPDTTFRFDGSDLMPSIVGSGSFWTGMVDWVKGTATTKVLKTIDDSWPTD
ncbi:MAG: alpha-glucoside transport system substrate-binding protein [Actinomycetota bacterium]|nr:alpha-glucoside transport system substrate-binding protein [Actinomycetota bacterium]